MTTRTHMRDGFALPVALMAMVVIGAIVTGGFYASNQENRLSLSSDLGSQAMYMAEYGLEETLGVWRNGTLLDFGTHPDTTEVSRGGRVIGSYVIAVRQLNARIFLITSEGSVQRGQQTAVRNVGSMVRTTQARPPYPSAMAVFGELEATGNSTISGHDKCGSEAPVAAVTAKDTSLVTKSGNATIDGEPVKTPDATMDSTKLSDFGDVDLDDLIASATRVYDGGQGTDKEIVKPNPISITIDDETFCDVSVKDNWGDPTAGTPCHDHMPIIHVKGNLDMQVGTGHGILIVEGDLHLTGNMHFYGVVIVMGSLFTAGTGNHIEGSVIVQGGGQIDAETGLTGNALVQYDSCRVEAAFRNNLRPRPLGGRSWVDLSAAVRPTAS